MNFHLIFEKSGDTLPFVFVNDRLPEIVTYFLSSIERLETEPKFGAIADIASKINDKIKFLHGSICEINQDLEQVLYHQFATCDHYRYLDQDFLNMLHVDMVKQKSSPYDIRKKLNDYKNSTLTQQVADMFPDEIPITKVSTVVDKLGKTNSYNRINDGIHDLESSMNRMEFRTQSVDVLEINNPFEKSLITNDIANLRFDFWHVGRLLYDKWKNFDNDLRFDDENTFDIFTDRLVINLSKPQEIPLSRQYVEWCQKHNKVPSGSYFNIGNLVDIEKNLCQYRTIILKNLESKNKFTIQF